MAVMFVTAPDGPLGFRHGHDTHLARARGLPHRHPGRQAHLRRPVPERQPEVPRGRGGARARRRDPHHARARRPLRRHGRAGRRSSAAPSSRRSSCRLARRGRASRSRSHDPNKGGTVDVDGVKVTLTHAQHSSSTNDGTYAGEPCGLVVELEDGFKLYFAGDTNVFGDMALIARIYEPDVAVLPIGGHYTMGPREAAVALELLGVKRCVPSPLRHVPDPHRHAGGAARARARRRGPRAGAGGIGRAVRERWFGATGRRVPELALEGSLDVEGALVLDGVDDDARAARGARAGHAGRRPRGHAGGGQGGARAARGRLCARPDRRAAGARSDGADLRLGPISTYSIVACDLDAGQWGVAVQSKFLAVGSVVPWAEPHVGAVATQAYANPRYGPDGLALLRQGLARRGGRQAADRGGRRARPAPARRRRRRRPRARRTPAPACHDWAGGRTGAGYAAQGNILVSAATVDALAETFEASDGLARRAAARASLAAARRRAATAAASSRRRCSSSSGTAATPASRTSSSTFASTTTRRRSRSCAASIACTTSSSAGRRARSGCRSTTSCEPRSRERLAALGYERLEDWAGARTSRSASTARTRSTRSCWTS